MPTLAPSRLKKALSYTEKEVNKALTAALSAMIQGGAVTAEATELEITSDFIWIEQKFQPDTIGSLTFGLTRPSAIAIGQKLLEASGLEGEEDSVALETLNEVFAQVSGAIATAVTGLLKKQVSTSMMTAKPAPPESDSETESRFALRLVGASDKPCVCVMCPSDEFLATVAPPEEQAVAFVPAPPVTVPLTSAAPAMSNTKNLELLLDVEMMVSISFGRTQLPLQQVLKLNTGSVVELNRTVAEPVDIIVNNAVIARGEVVVVEGNFGVRVNQVMSKQERLRSLV